MNANLRTAGRRVVSGNLEFRRGGFWSGDRTQYELGMTVRPMPGFSVEGRYEHNDVQLPEGDFATNLVRVEGGWQVSPWASFTGNVQYDDVSEIMGLFARFRWIIHPGNDLFLVYTHNWQNLEDELLGRSRFGTISRGATTKLNYTHRF
jgi:hypothetical protein